MMNVMRKRFFGRVVSVFALVMFVITMNDSMLYAASEIKVKHEPMAYFVPEKRIIVRAAITQGDADVKFIRYYFRAAQHADYVFITMESIGNGLYSGILPAPSKETQTIEYLFLVVDQKNKSLKTKIYTVNKKDDRDTPSWQRVSSEENIQVNTELAKAPTSVPGFSDSIIIDVVESSARFGVVSGGGTYAIKGTADASAGSAAAAPTGSSATTMTATTVTTTTESTWLSTATMIGLGAGATAVAVIGITAGINSTKEEDNTLQPPVTDVISTWEIHNKCADSSVETPVIFNVQLNETKGGSFSGSGQRTDYNSGVPITMSMSGNYDAKTFAISGSIDTTTIKPPFSCVRHDSFSFSIPSGSSDTGYQSVVEQGSTGCGAESGCVMQIRFVRK